MVIEMGPITTAEDHVSEMQEALTRIKSQHLAGIPSKLNERGVDVQKQIAFDAYCSLTRGEDGFINPDRITQANKIISDLGIVQAQVSREQEDTIRKEINPILLRAGIPSIL